MVKGGCYGGGVVGGRRLSRKGRLLMDRKALDGQEGSWRSWRMREGGNGQRGWM